MTQPRPASPLGTIQPNAQATPAGCACHPQNAAQVAPPPLVSREDLDQAEFKAFEELRQLAVRLEGLAEFAGSPVLTAPLEEVLGRAREQVFALRQLSARAIEQLRQRDDEAMRWASTVGIIRTLAGGVPLADLHHHAVRLGAGMDAVLEVQRLVEQRDKAREFATRLEAENAELVGAKLDAAGAAAHVEVLCDRINGWRKIGKIGADAARRANRDGEQAAAAARDQAGAALLAETVVFDERRCRGCGCTDEDCSSCIERTGQPCWWVEPDLCSTCNTEGRG